MHTRLPLYPDVAANRNGTAQGTDANTQPDIQQQNHGCHLRRGNHGQDILGKVLAAMVSYSRE